MVFTTTHVPEQNSEKSRHAAPEGVPEDDDTVPFATELDQLVHHLARQRGNRRWRRL